MLLCRSAVAVALSASCLLLSIWTLLGLAPDHAQAAQQGPVAAWSFDAGEGTTLEDVTGDGHEGTIEGAGWTTHGRYGDALSFDGEEGCVSIPDPGSLQLTEEFTLEAWVRSEGGGHDDPIIYKETTEGSGDGENPYSLYVGLGEDNRIEGFIGEEGEGGQAAVTDPELLPKDVWTHVALTYDGAHLRLYVDDELLDTTAALTPEASTGPLLIGCDGVEGVFHGRIDEVRLYERALGKGEVGADMTAPLQTPASGPVAAWSFDAGEGTTLEDVTGDGHEGTIEGAGWTGHGRFGDALEFSGNANECVTVPDSEDLRLNEEFTLEAWVKASAPLEEDPILYKEHLGEEGFGNIGYSLGLGVFSDGRPEGFIGEGGGAFTDAGANSSIESGVWTHLAFTYDGRHMLIYEDGELVGGNTQTTGPLAGGGPLYIGCDPNSSETFHGRIDEVRIYSRALGEDEVQADRSAPIQTPQRDPVAEYSFDQGEGTTLEDLSGNGHEGTIEGAGWTTHGRYGDALEFSGNANECVAVPDSEDLKLNEEFTLEAWVKPRSPLHHYPIIYKEHLGEEGFGNIGYSLGLGILSDGRPEGFIGEGGGAFTDAGANSSIESGVWTHLAFTYDGRHMRVYENGELAGQNTQTTGPLAGGGPLYIGCDPNSSETFEGRIDEVRIYDRALGEGEVGADLEAPIQTPKAGPIAAYSFDEGEGSTAEDATGNGHEGTIEGAGWTRGRYGDALRFVQNEGRQCVTVTDSPDLRLEEEFTLEAWVRPEEWLGGSSIVSKELEPGSGQSYSLGIGFTEYGRVEGWSENEVVYSPEPIEEDVWTHVAYTYDGQRARIYLDGKLVSDKAVGPRELASTGPLEIGCNSPSLGAQFFGRIDEVRLYDRALGEGEVDTDMEAPIQTPRQGPVAAYSFDEGEGTTVEDLTGDGHTATIHGAGWTIHGRYGGAMEFDAAGESYLSIPDSPELDLTEEFTLEAWVRPGAGSNEWAPIIAKETGGGEASHELAYWLYEGDRESNRPYGGTEPAPGEKDEAHAEDPLSVDVWSHLALTYDGAKVRLYVDGELIDCSPAPAGPPPVTEGELQIGGASELGDFFTGRIDEVRVYNRALGQAEVVTSMRPLPYAKTDEAFGVEETEAVLAATLYPQGEETKFKFEYGTTTAYGSFAPEAPYYNEEPESADARVEVEEWVGELEPETTYHYRVVATSPRGTVFGRDQTFTTGAATLEAEAASKWTGTIGINWNGTHESELPGLTWEAGAKLYRIPIGAPNSEVDGLFLAFAQKGITLLPDVVGVAADTVKKHETQIPSMAKGSKTREDWKKELKALYARYGPGGGFWEESAHKEYAHLAPEFWEIWNEENYGVHGMLNGVVSPARYGQLLEASHEAVTEHEATVEHEVSEHERSKPEGQVKLLFGGVLAVDKRSKKEEKAREEDKPLKKGEVDHIPIGQFIREVGHYQDYTALSLHPYAFTGNITNKVRGIIAATRSNLRRVRKDREEHGGAPEEAEKPIWVTEIGWGVKGNAPEPAGEKVEEDGHHILVTPETQANLLEETFDMMKNHSGNTGKHNYNIDAILFYNIKDNALGTEEPPGVEGPQSWDNHCGLVEDSGGDGDGHGQKRQAWEAFRKETGKIAGEEAE